MDGGTSGCLSLGDHMTVVESSHITFLVVTPGRAALYRDM